MSRVTTHATPNPDFVDRRPGAGRICGVTRGVRTASLLLTLCVVFCSCVRATEQRPNIVFLFSDDLTCQAISAYRYGLDLPPTPNLDRLASSGMLFENSFCGNSIWTLTRVCGTLDSADFASE